MIGGCGVLRADWTALSSRCGASVVFNATNSDPNVAARASSIRSGLPNAIFRSAEQSPGGLQSVFDDSNGFLGYTTNVYVSGLSQVCLCGI